MYKHILIPTDGSEFSNRAVRQGTDLARAIGARVTVVAVSPTFHTFSADPFMATSTPEQFRQECRAEAERLARSRCSFADERRLRTGRLALELFNMRTERSSAARPTGS
jgi:nucleotide-binding universal stress UspA family protein